MSTFGPYSLRVTTSGAIQYGVPTIVVRLAFAGSEIWAQKPKSANGKISVKILHYLDWSELTELNIPSETQQNVITLNISMNYTVSV